MHETLKRLRQRAGVASIVIQATIDRRNMPSKRLCGAAGFEFRAMLDEQYEAWSYEEDLP